TGRTIAMLIGQCPDSEIRQPPDLGRYENFGLVVFVWPCWGKRMNLFSSLRRIAAIFTKELTQMRRDRLTFATMAGVPVVQLIMFGYAVNADPRHLATAVVVEDRGIEVEDVRSVLETTGYFRVTRVARDANEARRLIEHGDVLFSVRVPAHFM